MGYSQLIIGDANITRFWQANQLAKPQLVGVPLRSVSCYDTLNSAFEDVTDGLDYVLLSVVTGFLIDEGSPLDVRRTSVNILSSVLAPLADAAKKSDKVEVCWPLLFTVFISFYVWFWLPICSHC